MRPLSAPGAASITSTTAHAASRPRCATSSVHGRGTRRQLACVLASATGGRAAESSAQPPGRGVPQDVLGVPRGATEAEIRSAFRKKIKAFHPDVYKGPEDEAQALTIELVEAYEVLVRQVQGRERAAGSGDTELEEDELRPWVNELRCQGRGCRYSCVTRAPSTFFFSPETGRARRKDPGAVLDAEGAEYSVQLAVGQCPEECIHWVTGEQQRSLEELLGRVIDGSTPLGFGALELQGAVSQFEYENNRRPAQKRKPKSSTDNVDWY